MSSWVAPNKESLEEVVNASKGHLILCSPYVSTPTLNIIANALPKRVKMLEFWTKLSARDWFTGASDPEGLLDFLREITGHLQRVDVKHANYLHSKIVISDSSKALAGSANLTTGGFMRNIETSCIVTGREVTQLREIVSTIRPKLSGITMEGLSKFVSDCTAKADEKEALLELIRDQMPPSISSKGKLIPYASFKSFLRRNRSNLAKEMHVIAVNLDGNNNQGKVKQAFYGVQRFLQEYPQYRSRVESLPLKWFDVAESSLWDDWRDFLNTFADEIDEGYDYSIPTLRGYLPLRYGGTLAGGGGGSNQLQRAWPLVGRILRANKP